jgi:hypothetical protein
MVSLNLSSTGYPSPYTSAAVRRQAVGQPLRFGGISVDTSEASTLKARPWLPALQVHPETGDPLLEDAVTLELKTFSIGGDKHLPWQLHGTSDVERIRMKRTDRGWTLPTALPKGAAHLLHFPTDQDKVLGYRFRLNTGLGNELTLLDGGAMSSVHPFRKPEVTPQDTDLFSLVTTQDLKRFRESVGTRRNAMLDVFQGNILTEDQEQAVSRLVSTPAREKINNLLRPHHNATPVHYQLDEATTGQSTIVRRSPSLKDLDSLWKHQILQKAAIPLNVGDVLVKPFIGADNASNHGYWTNDLYQVNDTMGNREYMRRLGRLMMSYDLSLVSDFAFIGRGIGSLETQSNLLWGPGSPYWDWVDYGQENKDPFAPFELPALAHAKPFKVGILATRPHPFSHGREINPDALGVRVINPPLLAPGEKNPHYKADRLSFVELFDPRTETPDGQIKLLDDATVSRLGETNNRQRFPISGKAVEQTLAMLHEEMPPEWRPVSSAQGELILQPPTGAVTTADGTAASVPKEKLALKWANLVTSWGNLQFTSPSVDDSGMKWDGQVRSILPNFDHPNVVRNLKEAFDFHVRTLLNDQTWWIAQARTLTKNAQVPEWQSPEAVLNTLKTLSKTSRLDNPEDGPWTQGKVLPSLPRDEQHQLQLARQTYQRYRVLKTIHQTADQLPEPRVIQQLTHRLFDEYPIAALPFMEDGMPSLFKASLNNPTLSDRLQTNRVEKLLQPVLNLPGVFQLTLPFRSFESVLNHHLRATWRQLPSSTREDLKDPITQSVLLSNLGEGLYLKILTGQNRREVFFNPDGSLKDPTTANRQLMDGLRSTFTDMKYTSLLTAPPVMTAEKLPSVMKRRLLKSVSPDELAHMIQEELGYHRKDAIPVRTEALIQAQAIAQSIRPLLKARLDAAKDFANMNKLYESANVDAEGVSIAKHETAWHEMTQKTLKLWNTLLRGGQDPRPGGVLSGLEQFYPKSEVIAELTNEGRLGHPLTALMLKAGHVWQGFVNYPLRNRLIRMVGEQNEAHKEPFAEGGGSMHWLNQHLQLLSQYHPTSATQLSNQNFTSHQDWMLTLDELSKNQSLLTTDYQPYRRPVDDLRELGRLFGRQGEGVPCKALMRPYMRRIANQPWKAQRVDQILDALENSDAKKLALFSKNPTNFEKQLTSPRMGIEMNGPKNKLDALLSTCNLDHGLYTIAEIPMGSYAQLQAFEDKFFDEHLVGYKRPEIPLPEKLSDPTFWAQVEEKIPLPLDPEQLRYYKHRLFTLATLGHQITQPSQTLAVIGAVNNATLRLLNDVSGLAQLAETTGVGEANLKEALPNVLGVAIQRTGHKHPDNFGLLPVPFVVDELMADINQVSNSPLLMPQEKTLAAALAKPQARQYLKESLMKLMLVPAFDKLTRVQALQIAYPGKPSLHLPDVVGETGGETYSNQHLFNRPTLFMSRLTRPETRRDLGQDVQHAYTQYRDNLQALLTLRSDPRFQALNDGSYGVAKVWSGQTYPVAQPNDDLGILPIFRPSAPDSGHKSVLMLVNSGKPESPRPSFENRTGSSISFPEATLRTPVTPPGATLSARSLGLADGQHLRVYRPKIDANKPFEDPTRVRWEPQELLRVENGELKLPSFQHYLTLLEE